MAAPCLACSTVKRKCSSDCPLSPFFVTEEDIQKVKDLNRVYGIKNVIAILEPLRGPQRGSGVASQRKNCIDSMVEEARNRIRDPVYGSVGVISRLEDKNKKLKTDIMEAEEKLRKLLGLPSASNDAQGNMENPLLLLNRLSESLMNDDDENLPLYDNNDLNQNMLQLYNEIIPEGNQEQTDEALEDAGINDIHMTEYNMDLIWEGLDAENQEEQQGNLGEENQEEQQ